MKWIAAAWWSGLRLLHVQDERWCAGPIRYETRALYSAEGEIFCGVQRHATLSNRRRMTVQLGISATPVPSQSQKWIEVEGYSFRDSNIHTQNECPRPPRCSACSEPTNRTSS